MESSILVEQYDVRFRILWNKSLNLDWKDNHDTTLLPSGYLT